MILPDLVLPSRINQIWTESGIDSYDECLDKKHFRSYPHNIVYKYNSRGFRDREWPDSIDDLRNAVWCIGDSFTVGIGSPFEHTWVYCVEKKLNKRVINVSMDGASNNWIARRAIDIYRTISPTKMIVMWSYLNRRESNDLTKSDEERKIYLDKHSNDYHNGDVENFYKCLNQNEKLSIDCIHFLVPYASSITSPAWEDIQINAQQTWNNIRGPDWPESVPMSDEEYNQISSEIKKEIKENYFIEDRFRLYFNNAKNAWNREMMSTVKYYGGAVPMLDRARDGHHFDILSSQWVADKVDFLWN